MPTTTHTKIPLPIAPLPHFLRKSAPKSKISAPEGRHYRARNYPPKSSPGASSGVPAKVPYRAFTSVLSRTFGPICRCSLLKRRIFRRRNQTYHDTIQTETIPKYRYPLFIASQSCTYGAYRDERREPGRRNYRCGPSPFHLAAFFVSGNLTEVATESPEHALKPLAFLAFLAFW